MFCSGFIMMKTVGEQLDTKYDEGSTGWYFSLATMIFKAFYYEMAWIIVHIAAVNKWSFNTTNITKDSLGYINTLIRINLLIPKEMLIHLKV